jgi:D-alanyl-D-alanine carboxypeptidase
VNFENWHFRYVGVESARYMQARNLVLEEYIQLLKKDGK